MSSNGVEPLDRRIVDVELDLELFFEEGNQADSRERVEYPARLQRGVVCKRVRRFAGQMCAENEPPNGPCNCVDGVHLSRRFRLKSSPSTVGCAASAARMGITSRSPPPARKTLTALHRKRRRHDRDARHLFAQTLDEIVEFRVGPARVEPQNLHLAPVARIEIRRDWSAVSREWRSAQPPQNR